MAQKRGFPRKWAIAFYVVLGAATVSVMMWMAVDRSQPEPLSAAERQDLAAVDEIDGKRLRHPLLGFSLAHPGPKFFQSQEAERKLGFSHDPSTRFHAFTELESGRMVIVSLSKRPHMSAKEFTGAVDSVTHMFLQKTAAGFDEEEAEVKTLQQQVDRERRQASMHMEIAGKAHVRLDARVARFAGDSDYLLMLIAVSPTDDSLAPIITSLHP